MSNVGVSIHFSKGTVFSRLLLSILILLAILSTLFVKNIFFKTNLDAPAKSVSLEDAFSTPIDDLSELFDFSETRLIYVGRDTCPECQIFNQIMQEEIMTRYPMLIIHKFDTSVWAEHEQFQKVLDAYKITGIPTVLLLRDNGTYEIIRLEGMSGQDIVQMMMSLIESEELTCSG